MKTKFVIIMMIMCGIAWVIFIIGLINQNNFLIISSEIAGIIFALIVGVMMFIELSKLVKTEFLKGGS